MLNLNYSFCEKKMLDFELLMIIICNSMGINYIFASELQSSMTIS